MSRGQANELCNRLEAAGLGAELAQKVIDSKGNSLAVEVVRCIENSGGQSMESFHGFEAKSRVSATAFVTASYFVTKPGLWVHSDFTSRITAAYPEALVPRGLDGVESFDLSTASYDREILTRPEMGGEENVRKHAFTPDQVADLINLQPEGAEGKLLTNGYANLFYVVGKDGVLFVVRVHWSAGGRRWGVDAWGLDGRGHWGAGYRVFRNTQTFEV